MGKRKEEQRGMDRGREERRPEGRQGKRREEKEKNS